MHLTAKEQAEEILLMSGVDVSQCMQCGKCSASCPVGARMDILPHRFVWEIFNGRINALLDSNTPWKCLSCFTCSARCPRGVDPAKVIEAVRLTIIRQQGENRLNVDGLSAQIDENMPQQALVSAFRKYNK